MVSGIVTVILLLLFLAGCIWAWSPRRKRDFDAAARLPLAEDEQAGAHARQAGDQAPAPPPADGPAAPPPHSNPGERHRE